METVTTTNHHRMPPSSSPAFKPLSVAAQLPSSVNHHRCTRRPMRSRSFTSQPRPNGRHLQPTSTGENEKLSRKRNNGRGKGIGTTTVAPSQLTTMTHNRVPLHAVLPSTTSA
ncbi:Cellobiose phosphorylase [Sesbania bispinosa]|nr:Cellobiose phosphorylase [Sesbania bispinosa]